jgi:signal peptidase
MRKKIKEIIYVLILVALLTPAIIYVVPFIFSDYYSSVVMSGSMEPAVPVGSIVVTQKIDVDNVKAGDIIVFQRSNSKTLHRVIDKIVENDSYYFKTKGDANENPDPWIVQPEQVQGSLLLTMPYYGYLIYFAGTPIGFILMVIIPATLLIANVIRKIIQLKKEEKFSAHENI